MPSLRVQLAVAVIVLIAGVVTVLEIRSVWADVLGLGSAAAAASVICLAAIAITAGDPPTSGDSLR